MGSADPAPRPERHRVVVAGAGVAGLEALLALSDLAPDRIAPVLVAPGDEFVYKPLLVTEQFGGTGALRIGLEAIVADAGATRVREALVSVDPGARTVRTSAGTELGYDALLIALGARPVPAVPGALTFADEDGAGALGKLLERLGRRNSKRLAFVIPPAATWSLAAYELALMTAAERSARRLSGVEVALITHETAPLELFGEQVAARIAARLAEAGVELRLGCEATRFAESRIELASGAAIEADDAVALPKLVAESIPGLPQTGDGFVRTDAQMRVAGLEHVWAAGDITAFPVKQGGLAAQQAGAAARAIASRAGAHVPIEPWSPVLRAALITGGPVEYLRAPIHDRDRSEASAGEALWSPPAKIAGRYLGAYLAPAFGAARSPKLVDLEPRSRASTEPGSRPGSPEALLAAADTYARLGDLAGALGWLELVERLDFVIPPEYLARRQRWSRELDRAAPNDPAAERVDPVLAGAEEAISDLQRRLGWLRERERREGGEMAAELTELGRGIEELLAQSRKRVGAQ
jgi:sulfide:quinone oxidoreductase